MILLYNQEQFNSAKSEDKFPCQCENCFNTFYKSKRDILKVLRGKRVGKYCSKKCAGINKLKKQTMICTNCNKIFTMRPFEIKQSKSENHFCSQSCAATYNNKHKTTGNRRSKLEIYLEEQLNLLYPNLKILFNNKTTINSELDIYFPELKLAFELNGIFHYESIYGQDKLNQIQNNDNRKFQACIEADIELCIIDSSSLKYFKESNAQKYLDIIAKIIQTKL
jgi:hypothetical protein